MERQYSRQLKNSLSKLLFPPVCVHCGTKITSQKEFLCQRCLNSIGFIEPLLEKSDLECNYDNLITICKYRKVVVSMIHELKYYGMPSIGKYIAQIIYKRLVECNLELDIDVITSVPLHFVKEKERGYNQSSLIASELALLMQCDYSGKLIERVTYTASQATLEHDERLDNLKKAFKLKKNIDLNNKTIVLLDDVFTTGTTVDHCCSELKKANPKNIIVLTMGRA